MWAKGFILVGAKGFISVGILFGCGGHFVAKGFNLVRIPF